MEFPAPGGRPRRDGARGRSPGAGLVPPGTAAGWIRLDRPANDNPAPWGHRIRHLLRLSLPWATIGLAAWSLWHLL
ncbi:hypothetical protein [Zavarzinia sp.]|uniref:hypothetical protein n=1 Tax=Zavarzinia sp. TaxID=2027920 RepID=UPI003562A12D